MVDIILQAISLFFMIFLGFIMKRIGILQKNDGTMIARIIMNITLPAVIIVNFIDLKMDKKLLLFTLLALIWFMLQLLLAFLYSRKKIHKPKPFICMGPLGLILGTLHYLLCKVSHHWAFRLFPCLMWGTICYSQVGIRLSWIK